MAARNCHDEVTMDDRFQTRASNIQSVLCVWSVVIYTATHPAGASSEARGPIARPALMQIDPCLKPGVTRQLYLSGQEVLVGTIRFFLFLWRTQASFWGTGQE